MRNEVMEPVSIVGIYGSVRKASFSTEILGVLANESAPAIHLHVVTLEDIPLSRYDETSSGRECAQAFDSIL